MNRPLWEIVLPLVIVGGICAVATVFLVRAIIRGRHRVADKVHEWAKGRDLRIVELGDTLWGGPFWSWTELLPWTTSAPVYRIVAEDRNGRRRGGHLRFKQSLLDAYSEREEAQVRWDDGRP